DLVPALHTREEDRELARLHAGIGPDLAADRDLLRDLAHAPRLPEERTTEEEADPAVVPALPAVKG
ncbi:hypothetical protein PMAYCL1PPCAC_20267, partial [Pristionchus mayeri]